MNDDTRIGTIDIAKGVGIVLVIIGHALPSDNLLRIFVYTFHMPLFFILAGMVMKPANYDRGMIGDMLEERMLIGSYFFYSILFIVFDIVVRVCCIKEMSFEGVLWNIYRKRKVFQRSDAVTI